MTQPNSIMLSNDETQLNISVDGYEYPDLTEPITDYDDWLNIKVSVSGKNGEYECIHPTTLTFHIPKLIKWLKDLADGVEGVESEFNFHEPTITFKRGECVDDVINLTVVLESEFRPPWCDDENGYPINFTLTRQDVLDISDGITKQFEQFPIRCVRYK